MTKYEFGITFEDLGLVQHSSFTSKAKLPQEFEVFVTQVNAQT